MNFGLMTTYFVAGILMLGIVSVNIMVQNSSAELTIAQMTKERVHGLTIMLDDDLPNMGYDVHQSTLESMGAVLTYANENRIQFYRNLYDDHTRNPDLITWELLDDTLPHTNNPDHRVLIRVVEDGETGVPDTTQVRSGVTRFELRYYDTLGSSLNDNMSPPAAGAGLGDIKQIHMILELQSSERIGRRGSGRFVRSVWEKRYTPPNLQ